MEKSSNKDVSEDEEEVVDSSEEEEEVSLKSDAVVYLCVVTDVENSICLLSS